MLRQILHTGPFNQIKYYCQHMQVFVSPALDSRTSSTANKRAGGSSWRSDGSVARPGRHVTSRHQWLPPSPATASRPWPHCLPLVPAACGWSSRRSRSCWRNRPAEPSHPGKRPGPDLDLLHLPWAWEYSAGTVDTGSRPGGGQRCHWFCTSFCSVKKVQIHM